MKSWTIRSIALVAIAAKLFAQSTTTAPTPPAPADQATHLVNQLTTLLDLTSAQQTSATGIFTTEFTTLATLQTSFQTAQASFLTAIENNSSSAITAAATQLGGLTQQRLVAQGTADGDFYAQLTSTQQTKYLALKLTGIGGPGFGGPGHGGPGPGGPGGPPPQD
jgi:Spy/CpxP family protein refolding chaperone